MLIKNRKLELLLFLLFFLHTISPMSYTYTTENAAESDGPNNAFHLTRNFHIYLWELIYIRLVLPEDTSQTDSFNILLKKKRAIVPEDIISKLKSTENMPVFECPLPAETLSFIYLLSEEKTKHTFKGKPFLFSGLSPPSV